MTRSIVRPRPVASGPPMTETIPVVAVIALLQDRPTATAR